MKTFKQFLSEKIDVTTRPFVDESYLLSAINRRCGEALGVARKGRLLYRGIDSGEKEPPYCIWQAAERDPTQRRPYAAFLLRTFEAWKSYPDRGHSLICATNRETALRYATGTELYAILPFDGATLAVCPKPDIRQAFPRLYDRTPKIDFETLALNIGTIANALFPKNVASTPEALQVQLKKVTPKLLSEKASKLDGATAATLRRYSALIGSSGTDNLYDTLDDAMDPRRSGFKVATLAAMPASSDNHEIWTESPVVAIKLGTLSKSLVTELGIDPYLLGTR